MVFKTHGAEDLRPVGGLPSYAASATTRAPNGARRRLRLSVATAMLMFIISVVPVLTQVEGASAAPRATGAQSAHATAKAAGKWTWWGYRTNSYETWAVATQNPSYYRTIPQLSFLSTFTYVLAWTWKLTAQNARSMGQCIGFNWAGTGLIVGCA